MCSGGYFVLPLEDATICMLFAVVAVARTGATGCCRERSGCSQGEGHVEQQSTARAATTVEASEGVWRTETKLKIVEKIRSIRKSISCSRHKFVLQNRSPTPY